MHKIRKNRKKRDEQDPTAQEEVCVNLSTLATSQEAGKKNESKLNTIPTFFYRAHQRALSEGPRWFMGGITLPAENCGIES
jgi:hypothetical protein